ncbi:hypothetical protein EV702DRAFT_1087621 [Suillus placidus]|uniref:Uncharacterized protein n=1 Tax=Suillus placidus TaxID=48579 RepID=A0A9P6ZYZ3_9AGAM|nr:hypothetical protein EV702DRAFT_1087621 [Suillus placidus]
MRFSCAIVLAVVAALASSISATPIDDGADAAEGCPWFCYEYYACSDCGTEVRLYVHSESESCHIGAVWFMTLTRELVVVGC